MRPHAETLSLTSLIERGTYLVPPYQRLYSWESLQIDSFFESLGPLAELSLKSRSSRSKIQDVFFGPVVIEGLNQKNIPVVDGQQRFTTFVLLFAAARAYVFENYSTAKLNSGTTFDDWAQDALKKRGQVQPFLVANRTLAPVFQSAIYKGEAWRNADYWKNAPQPGSGIASSVAQVKANLAQLQNLIKELLIEKFGEWPDNEALWNSEKLKKRAGEEIDFLHNFLQNVLNHCLFLVIQVDNTEQALELFSSLNDRGLRLAPADIIKAEIFERGVGKNGDLTVDNFETHWDTIVSNTSSSTSWDVNKFLRHWCMARSGKKVNMNGVVKSVRSLIADSSTARSSSNLLEMLNSASVTYKKVLSPENLIAKELGNGIRDLRGSFQRMNLLGDYHRILLPKIVELKKISDIQKFELVREVEKYVARSAFAGSYPQERENLFVNLASKFESNLSFAQAKNILKELFANREKAQFPNDNDFREALQKHSSDARRIDKKTKYVIFLYSALQERARDKQFFPLGTDIEHLVPQGPKIVNRTASISIVEDKPDLPAPADYWYDVLGLEPPNKVHTREYVSLVNEFGNLTVLENYINQSIQDAAWPVKIKGRKDEEGTYVGIKHSKCAANAKIWKLEREQLSKKWITNRTEKIIEEIIKITRPS